MKVKEVMTKGVFTVQPEGTVSEMRRFVADLGVHALPIVDLEGIAVGMVTSSDLEPDLPEDTLAFDLMSDRVYEIDGGEDARNAAQMMLNHTVHHLVVTDRGQAVGMLSSFDLLRVVTEGVEVVDEVLSAAQSEVTIDE